MKTFASLVDKRVLQVRTSALSKSTRGHASTSTPFYVTTPIFYVNAKPHIGHLYTLVLTDVLRRYRIFVGQPCIMLTGTDEHGMKIQAAAQKAKQDPQTFCDQVSEVFRELPSKANVGYDKFIRTSGTEHKVAVSHFWRKLKEKGHIFKASHSGWYSISDETFFPESAISQRENSVGGSREHYSIETGNVVTWSEEENYHFRLSAFRDRLLDFYKLNPTFVIPESRYDDVVTSVQTELQDLSVSRPQSRLTWGIPVPDDSSQTIYVWLDALVNYITAAGYPDTTKLWPADIHVIGKDIVRFHCIYWPAFLMAAGLELPKQVVTHAHWTMDNFKMSKSRGNVADPWMAIDRFGVDSVRYYLMRDGRLENDGNYSSEHLILRHNHELVNGLGNLVSRVSSKTFDIAGILSRPPPQADLCESACKVAEKIQTCVSSYHENMSANLIYKAVADVLDLISSANTLMQHEEPWAKSCSAQTRRDVLYICLESARLSALLLQPIMPESMARLLDRLGVEQDARSSEYAIYAGDERYRPAQGRLAHHFLPIDDGTDSAASRSALKLRKK